MNNSKQNPISLKMTISPKRFWAVVSSAAILISLSLSLVSAQPSGASFLSVDPSPRSFSLGGANPAASLGAQGMYSNPASMSQTDRKFEFFSAYSSMLDGVHYGYGAFSINRSVTSASRVEAIGFSFTNLRVGGLDSRDGTGSKTGDSFGGQDSAYGLSLAYKLSSSLKMGMTGKMVQSEIAGVTSNRSIAGDFGLSYAMNGGKRPLTAGMNLSNVGEGVKFLSESDPLPTALNLGANLGLGPVNCLASVSTLLRDQKTSVGLGVEMGMGPVSLRAGYRSDASASGNLRVKSGGSDMSDIASNFVTGMGLKLGSMKIDYAVAQPSSELGISHRMSLTWQWGVSAIEAEAGSRASAKKGKI